MNQTIRKLLWKKIGIGFLTVALLMTTISIPGSVTHAGTTTYTVNSIDVSVLNNLFDGSATVTKSDGIVTITLTDDLMGMIIFKLPDEDTIIFNAAGHSVFGAGHNEAIQLDHENWGRIILTGDGIYHSGTNNVVFVGGYGGLTIESGTFVAAPVGGNKIINGSVLYRMAEGSTYYTVTDQAGDVFKSYNRQQRTSYSVGLSSGTLVVAQHNGTVPTYNIEKLAATHGSYTVKVNDVESSTAKPDDRITVTAVPDVNYKLVSFSAKDQDTKEEVFNSFGGSNLEYSFYMHDNDLSIELSYGWQNQIATQPTAGKPTVVTNNPIQVESYQWYQMVSKDVTIVNGTAGENEQAVDNVFNGTYNATTKRWSTTNAIMLEGQFSDGYQLVFSDIIGTVGSCSGAAWADGTFVVTSVSSIAVISFSAPGGSCKITLKKMVEVPIEGQTGATYKGPEGDVYCKVKFLNKEAATSNTISYKKIEEPKYVITAGANSVYKSSNMGTGSIVCSGPLEELTGIYVDNKLVDPSNYTLKSGSTILTLKEAYLKGLSAGTHLITFEYGATTVQTNFQVQKESVTPIKDDVPKTGDAGGLGWLTILFAACGAGFIYSRKKKRSIQL